MILFYSLKKTNKKSKKIMNVLIALLLLLIPISIVDSLNLDEICFKDFECDGKHCALLKCSNSQSYDCDKFTCTSDVFKCDEYHSMGNELESKKKIKTSQSIYRRFDKRYWVFI